MGKKIRWEDECRDIMMAFQEEAAKNAIHAFTEGYTLGMHHAEQMFKEKHEDQSA